MFKKFMTIALVTLLAQLICVKTTVVARPAFTFPQSAPLSRLWCSPLL